MSKIRVGSKVRKTYDQAQTPYQRLLAFNILSKENRDQLEILYESLNPVQLQREMNKYTAN